MSTTGSSPTPSTHSTFSSPQDDWRPVLDPNERRRIQNRLAQRKYRDKARVQREIETRREYDERMACAAYVPPDPANMAPGSESGLPWGSISLRYVLEAGQIRQQQALEQRSSHHHYRTQYQQLHHQQQQQQQQQNDASHVRQHQQQRPHYHQREQLQQPPRHPAQSQQQQQQQQQQQPRYQVQHAAFTISRHNSPLTLHPRWCEATAMLPTGASSSVGLHLIHEYARGHPFWSAWQAQMPPVTSHHPPSSVTTDSSTPSNWS